jgi:hypothetical protein
MNVCKSKEAQAFLKKLRKIDCLIKNKIIEQKQWKDIAFGITAQIGGERVQGSGNYQKMADAVGRYTDIEAEINEYIDKLVDARKDVIYVIEQLTAIEYDVLHMLYVQYMNIDEVAEVFDKSSSWVATVRGSALKNVQRILDDRKKGKL